MRLSQFIQENKKQIIAEWGSFAKTLGPAADSMTQLQLKDHIEQILLFIAKDIESAQTASQQTKKSHGNSDNTTDNVDSAATIHGSFRHGSGFDIIQMVSEYRALRGSVIKLWSNSKEVLTNVDMLDLTRFNESIDQALAESVVSFTEKVDYAKDLLLGVMGHDIRSPLGAVKMLAQMLPRLGDLNEKQTKVVEQIEASSSRVTDIVGDLLDLTRARLGTGLPVVKRPMNLEKLGNQIVDEFRIQNSGRDIRITSTGNMDGNWDVTRLGQVFSNLIGNALQYGEKSSPITITIKGEAKSTAIVFHNNGVAIASDKLKSIFNSFTRGEEEKEINSSSTANLGLGLFITKEIVLSHGGTINVTSDNNLGTTFTVKLPRVAKLMAA